MTDLRKAAEQALEVLENLHGGCTDSSDGTIEAVTVWCPEVIDSLRAALAEPQDEPKGGGNLHPPSDLRAVAQQAQDALFLSRDFTELYDTDHSAWVNEKCHNAIEAIRTALAEPTERDSGYAVEPLYTIQPKGGGNLPPPSEPVPLKPPNLEPVIVWLENGCDPKEAAKELRIYQATMLYTHPAPQRQPPQQTHNEECYQWHHECAIAEVKRLRAERFIKNEAN